jgi:hypothetical protein
VKYDCSNKTVVFSDIVHDQISSSGGTEQLECNVSYFKKSEENSSVLRTPEVRMSAARTVQKKKRLEMKGTRRRSGRGGWCPSVKTHFSELNRDSTLSPISSSP